MAVIQPSMGSKAPVIDDDIYEVVCLDVKETTLDTPDQFGKTEKLDFKIALEGVVDEDGEQVILDPRCNKAWSERATLFKWAQAFGIDADPLQPIDTDQFKGLKARADIRTESEGKWPRVHDFLPLPKKGRPPVTVRLGANASEEQLDAFWKTVLGANFKHKDVLPFCEGDLANMANKTPGELDQILVDMGLK